MKKALEKLVTFGIKPLEGPVCGPRGRYAQIKDPDWRTIILTEAD